MSIATAAVTRLKRKRCPPAALGSQPVLPLRRRLPRNCNPPSRTHACIAAAPRQHCTRVTQECVEDEAAGGRALSRIDLKERFETMCFGTWVLERVPIVSNHLSFVIAGLVLACPGDPVLLLGLDARGKPAHDDSVIQLDRKQLWHRPARVGLGR